MEFLKAVIRPSYWLTHQHPVPDVWVTGLTFFFAALLVIAFVASVLTTFQNRLRKPWRTFFFKLAVWGWVTGFLGYCVLFFSVERVWLISARIFYLFWLVFAAYWLFRVISYLVKDVPRLIAMQDSRAGEEKYLPKRKK